MGWAQKDGGNCLRSLESWVVTGTEFYYVALLASVCAVSHQLLSCSHVHCLVGHTAVALTQFHCTTSGGGHVCLF